MEGVAPAQPFPKWVCGKEEGTRGNLKSRKWNEREKREREGIVKGFPCRAGWAKLCPQRPPSPTRCLSLFPAHPPQFPQRHPCLETNFLTLTPLL